MNVFLDANILISVLNKEVPLFSYTSRILSLADHPSFTMYTSPTCLAIAYYFSEKKSGRIAAKKKIELLARKIRVATADQSAVFDALRNKNVHDFEDGLEYYSAVRAKCSCIVTEDPGDFYFSEIDVLTAKDFLLMHTKP